MRIMVTAGPTREYFDSVRFISNSSSGRTGFSIAQAAHRRGHRTILISGPVQLQVPKGVEFFPVVSAKQMYRQVLKLFAKTDVVVMTAAVADYRPARKSSFKVKKANRNQIVELIPNPDILAELGKRKKNQILIGFALEDRAGKRNALQKFRSKNLDSIILNSPGALADVKNRLKVYTEFDNWQDWPEMPKPLLGKKIVALAERLWRLQK